MVEFVRIWRDTPKVVYSRTLEWAQWNATVVRDVVPAEVLALKARAGGHVVLGGSELGSERKIVVMTPEGAKERSVITARFPLERALDALQSWPGGIKNVVEVAS